MNISLKSIILLTILAYVISEHAHYKDPWDKCEPDEVKARVGNYWWCAKPCETNADCPTDFPSDGKNLRAECDYVKDIKNDSEVKKLCTMKCDSNSVCPPGRDNVTGLTRGKSYCTDDVSKNVTPVNSFNTFMVTSKTM